MAEEEAKQAAEEEAKREAEEEAKRVADEEATRVAEEEAKRVAEEEAKKPEPTPEVVEVKDDTPAEPEVSAPAEAAAGVEE